MNKLINYLLNLKIKVLKNSLKMKETWMTLQSSLENLQKVQDIGSWQKPLWGLLEVNSLNTIH